MQRAGGRQAVLVTRPAEATGPTLARLQEMGFAAISAPMLDIKRLLTDLPPPSELQAVLVTSARALSALPASYRHLRLLAVGDATAASAQALGHTNVLSADGDATDLLRLALTHCAIRAAPVTEGAGADDAGAEDWGAQKRPTQPVPQGETVLLLSGVGEGAALAAKLAEYFHLAQRFVYQAQPVAELPETARTALQAARLPAATAGPRLEAALFFSAATAETFVTLAEAAGLRDTVIHVEALAISAATARVLARLPWRAVRVAPRPNQDELLALLR